MQCSEIVVEAQPHAAFGGGDGIWIDGRRVRLFVVGEVAAVEKVQRQIMADQQQEWLDFAKSVALEAGDIMRKYFGKKPDVHLKANNTIVTVADEEIVKAMRRLIE